MALPEQIVTDARQQIEQARMTKSYALGLIDAGHTMIENANETYLAAQKLEDAYVRLLTGAGYDVVAD